MSDRQLGLWAADYQEQMAGLWSEHGANTVHDLVNELSQEQLVVLVMANIGARTATL